MITVIHALSYVGAVAVLLNTRLSREELLWQMDDAEVICLVTIKILRLKIFLFIHSPK